MFNPSSQFKNKAEGKCHYVCISKPIWFKQTNKKHFQKIKHCAPRSSNPKNCDAHSTSSFAHWMSIVCNTGGCWTEQTFGAGGVRNHCALVLPLVMSMFIGVPGYVHTKRSKLCKLFIVLMCEERNAQFPKLPEMSNGTSAAVLPVRSLWRINGHREPKPEDCWLLHRQLEDLFVAARW